MSTTTSNSDEATATSIKKTIIQAPEDHNILYILGHQNGAGEEISRRFSGSFSVDKSGRIDRGISNSNSNCELIGESEHDSRYRRLNRKEILGGGRGESVTGKESWNIEMVTDIPELINDGPSSKSMFVFGSGSNKINSCGLDDIGGNGNGKLPISLGQPGLNVLGLRKFETMNITNTMFVEECIGPMNSDTNIRKKNGDNGRKAGQWKKAARNNSRGSMISNQEVACGKRKDVVIVDSFMEGNKKSKLDSSSSDSIVTSAG
ncbi:hypothetical protein LWI28_001317 [Acer negundo]|uniref:Uncharacterized protein n=1 Tax=Acer negundo TaxID=4023 RepID=A0AAD5ILN3_ACENE|nr:hypothetical protein LWI28_001317 [Acer negundo]